MTRNTEHRSQNSEGAAGGFCVLCSDSCVPCEVGLYVHVAFCRTKCYYCDFNTYAGIERLIPRYVEALAAEIAMLPHALPDEPPPGSVDLTIGSVFVGGGTPSVLSAAEIATILDAARRYPMGAAAEITIEANPDDRAVDYYRDLREVGVNRLSLGVQSFDDGLLRRLGRRHDAAAAVEAVEQARRAGFENLSLDLMFGLPDQTLAQWQATLDRALVLAPEHLSLYNLTVEPETPFGRWAAAGRLRVPDDDAAADMYQTAIDRLGAAGYSHYEISNWARWDPGRDYRAQHNLRYWRNQPYLGVGAGAHSCFGGYRYAIIRSPFRYAARLAAGQSPVDSVERIDRPLELAETMLLGLRLSEGIDVAAFAARFGETPGDVYGAILAELADYGLLTTDRERVRLTERGRFLGNEVFYRFLPTSSSA